MDKKHLRKPISNFFIKKDLQMRLITKILFAVMTSTVVCVATLIFTYLAKYKSTVFYRVTFDMDASIGNRENIISIILPSLLIASLINIIIGIGIGLYASRKYAVPIFKLEQWVHLLRDGHITAKLRFREKEEMKDLCNNCNQLAEELCVKFDKIDKYTRELQQSHPDDEPVKRIQSIMDTFQIKSDAIEVHTSFIRTDQLPKEKQS